jgi:quinol monooxygenase YgiN
MIKRIVKMSFVPEKVDDFLAVYKANWDRIRGFKGCNHVELLRDENSPNVFFTYSLWESEAHLNTYRESELFNSVWSRTKVLFNDKPQAWTVSEIKFDQL